jgi:hypothetical protein
MDRIRSLLLLVLLSGFVSAAAPVPVQTIKDYAETIKGRHAYGMYIQGKKVGWSILDLKFDKHDGKDVFVIIDETYLETKRDSKTVKMHMTSATTFGLEGTGDIIRIDEPTEAGGRKTTRTAERQGDVFVVKSSIDPDNPRKVKPPKKNLEDLRKETNWLRDAKKGDTLDSYSVTLEDADIDTKETYTFKGKKTLRLGGVDTEVFEASVNSKGGVQEVELLRTGVPIKTVMGGFLEQRTEPEATAKKLEAVEIDILAASSIPIDRPLGDPHGIVALNLTVHGLGDYPLPQSHRQQLKSTNEKDVMLLELHKDFKPEKDAPLKEEERKKMLEATPTVQSDAKKVVELAKKIVGDEQAVHKKAALLRKWVYRNLKKSYDDNATTTLEVLKNMAGDCTEHTLLFVSLARAVGIPAREVGGVASAGAESKLFGWHAWPEYHDGKQWVSTDPTWNEERVDATHIKFSDSADDMAWTNVLGKVKFKVVKLEKN